MCFKNFFLLVFILFVTLQTILVKTQTRHMTEKIKVRKGIKDFEKNRVNPFKEDLRNNGFFSIKQKQKDPTLTECAVVETGECFEMMRNSGTSHYWKDSQKFSKIFHSEKTAHLIRDLSTPALKFFAYMATNLGLDDDKIIFSFNQFSEFTGHKTKFTYYTAVTELLEKEVIALTESPYTFFINPNILFNGRRQCLLEDPDKAYADIQQTKLRRDYNFDESKLIKYETE